MTRAELEREIRNAQKGKAAMELYKKGWEMADAEGDYDAQVEYRMEYMYHSAYFEDGLDMYIVFPEILKLHDRRIEEFGEDVHTLNILWKYKWILENASQFYQISKEQYERFCEDLKRRFIQSGCSLRPYYQYRMNFYLWIDPKMTEIEYDNFLECERDVLSDCHACERSWEVAYLLERGREEEAKKKAEPLFNATLQCAEVPEMTYGDFLRYYNKKIVQGHLEYVEEAGTICEKLKAGIAIRDVANDFRPDIFMYYTLTAPVKALNYYKKNWNFYEKNRSPITRFYFATAASRFFGGIKKKKYKMIMEPSYIFYEENDTYDVEKIKSYYENDALDIARKFDKRNGNDFYENLYRELMTIN